MIHGARSCAAGEFTRIVFRQKKTGGQEYIDINPQAVAFMGNAANSEDRVFPASLFFILPDGAEAVGGPCRDNERHHLSQRAAHLRRDDA